MSDHDEHPEDRHPGHEGPEAEREVRHQADEVFEPGAEPAGVHREHSRWEGVLPRFSLDRRITVLVLLATALVVGAVAAASIPLELFPRGFTAPFLSVSVPWSDAPAPEVLEKVIEPLEEEVSTVRGLENLSSFATTGFGRLALQFKTGTDMDVAYREVRDRVERARALMPEDADRIYIRKDDASGIPVAMVGVLIDEGLSDAYDLIQTEVITRLERIDGVASVQADGLIDKEILIELDRQRTEAAGLNIYLLAQQLQNDNFSLASGEIYSGGKKLLLRSVARYADLDALRDRKVAPTTRLGDIADVTYEQPEREFRIRVNSKPAIAIQILKEGDANTLEVSREVAETVEELGENPRIAALELAVIFNQGDVILESLDTLLDSGKVGALFAIGVLFFFLRRIRLTLIITLSIPLSIVIAMTVMYFAGESLNILSLLGLMICVGLLVDNSVVVAENIYRLHREGLSRRDAVIRGAGEIALAIVMATLTTVAVFLPVSLVDGMAQFFLLRLSIPISVSLVASLFVALIFIPLSVYLTLPARGNGRRMTPLRRLADGAHQRVNGVLRVAYDQSFERLNHAYTRLLEVALANRGMVLAALLVVLAATGAAMGQVKVVEQDENERPGFEIDVSLPETHTFEETETWFLEVEKLLEENKDEWGLDGYFFFHRTNFGEIQGWFNNPPTVELTPREVTEAVIAALPEKPGVTYETGQESQTEAETTGSVHTFTLNGEDPDQLEAVAEELEEFFVRQPGVLGLRGSGQDPAPSEMALVVDRERAQRQEINPETVAGVVSYALRGQQLPKFYRDGREIDVRVRFREEDRELLGQLESFEVPVGSGPGADGVQRVVPLSSITDTRMLQSAKVIRRMNKRMARTVTLELEEGKEEETRARLMALAAGIDLPEGVSFGGGQTAQGPNEDLQAMGFAAIISIIFIYLLMGFLFESSILPLSILTTIPMAGIGVVFIHLLAGRDIDMLGMVGLVLLIGVVVNNGIVLVDYVNRLRAEGVERARALLLAASRRFRPIMMTALTTICGMVPLTIGPPSTIGLSYKSFGLTLIGGLTTATFLTLLVVPVFYTIFDDFRSAGWAMFRRAGRRHAAGGEAVQPGG